jgi:hypothetical protein
MTFRPKNPRIRLIYDACAKKEDRPLYAGKTIVKIASYQADAPTEVSVPLVAWLAGSKK